MPPIKRTQKSVTPAPRRRLAGHAGQTRPEGGNAAGPTTWDERDDDDEVGGTGTGAGRGERRAGRRPGGRTIAYSAIAVGLVAGAVGVFLATEPGVDVDNRAFVDRGATEEVLSAATTNVQRLVAIDHETLDEYHDSLGEFLTPKLVNELDENWPALRDSYEQSATSVDAEVREAGLAYLQGDKAEVLLVQDVSMTRDGAAAGSTSGTYLVGLDKIDGVWKLSRIPDLPS